jgi:hypothetical protein
MDTGTRPEIPRDREYLGILLVKVDSGNIVVIILSSNPGKHPAFLFCALCRGRFPGPRTKCDEDYQGARGYQRSARP